MCTRSARGTGTTVPASGVSPGPEEKGGSGVLQKGLSERRMFMISVLSYVYNSLVECLIKRIYYFGQIFFFFFFSLWSTSCGWALQVDHLPLCALGDTMSGGRGEVVLFVRFS